MIALLLGLSGVAQAQGCPDLGATLREVSAAIDDVRLEDAQSLSQQAREGLECQTEVVKSLTLLGLYQSAGAVAYFLGNFNEADEAFARAIAVAPASRLDPAYGEAPASIYENLREATMSTGGGEPDRSRGGPSLGRRPALVAGLPSGCSPWLSPGPGGVVGRAAREHRAPNGAGGEARGHLGGHALRLSPGAGQRRAAFPGATECGRCGGSDPW